MLDSDMLDKKLPTEYLPWKRTNIPWNSLAVFDVFPTEIGPFLGIFRSFSGVYLERKMDS